MNDTIQDVYRSLPPRARRSFLEGIRDAMSPAWRHWYRVVRDCENVLDEQDVAPLYLALRILANDAISIGQRHLPPHQDLVHHAFDLLWEFYREIESGDTVEDYSYLLALSGEHGPVDVDKAGRKHTWRPQGDTEFRVWVTVEAVAVNEHGVEIESYGSLGPSAPVDRTLWAHRVADDLERCGVHEREIKPVIEKMRDVVRGCIDGIHPDVMLGRVESRRKPW